MKNLQGFDQKFHKIGKKLISTKINLVNIVKTFWKTSQRNAA